MSCQVSLIDDIELQTLQKANVKYFQSNQLIYKHNQEHLLIYQHSCGVKLSELVLICLENLKQMCYFKSFQYVLT